MHDQHVDYEEKKKGQYLSRTFAAWNVENLHSSTARAK